MTHMILEVSRTDTCNGRNCGGHTTCDPDAADVIYFEGFSGKLAASERAAGRAPVNGWFTFEDAFADGCMELTRLGFTAEQITDAVRSDRKEV